MVSADPSGSSGVWGFVRSKKQKLWGTPSCRRSLQPPPVSHLRLSPWGDQNLQKSLPKSTKMKGREKSRKNNGKSLKKYFFGRGLTRKLKIVRVPKKWPKIEIFWKFRQRFDQPTKNMCAYHAKSASKCFSQAEKHDACLKTWIRPIFFEGWPKSDQNLAYFWTHRVKFGLLNPFNSSNLNLSHPGARKYRNAVKNWI